MKLDKGRGVILYEGCSVPRVNLEVSDTTKAVIATVNVYPLDRKEEEEVISLLETSYANYKITIMEVE